MTVKIEKRRLFYIALAAAVVLLYILPLGSYPLMEPDEGRYAEIPREMIESGNYITPMLNYVKYFEKPVFLYWMNAASFHIFGQNEFAARIGTTLCALAGAGVTAWLGTLIYGLHTGALAGIILLTSLLYFAVGTINITDMALSFFLTLTFASFWAAQKSGNRRWYLAFYFGAAMAVLTKGLIGFVLPGAVILFYILITKKWKLFYEPLYVPGIILFFAITVPWFYLVCRDNPDFFRFFFIQEHFLRYTTKMHHRYEPFWYFIPMIPAGVMPWTAFFFALFSKKSVVRSPETPEKRDAVIYLLLWFGVIFLFFSASDSKLIPYIVPCLPPLAILMGADMERMARDRAWHGGVLQMLCAFGIILGAGLLIYPLVGKEATAAQAWPIALNTGLPLIFGPLMAWYLTSPRRRDFGMAMRILCFCSLVFIAGLLGLYQILAPTRTMKDVSAVIMKNIEPGDTIAAHAEVLQGIPFYTGKRVLMVGTKGELEYGLEQPEGKGWYLTEKEFLPQWRSKARSFILVTKRGGRFDKLFPDGKTGASKRVDVGKYIILFNRGEGTQ